ncbi:hypothetical protein ACIBJI_32750 [Nocardia sp. NPDC050408]|uniref:hypothetical protein n=1 Tax=Nocardia sp. NPDC050408 TaxID=3364319 RepID=UPI003793D2A6
MNSSELLEDIVKIAEYLARNAEASGGAMKWNEEAKIKAGMMNEPKRWAPACVGDHRSARGQWRSHLLPTAPEPVRVHF